MAELGDDFEVTYESNFKLETKRVDSSTHAAHANMHYASSIEIHVMILFLVLSDLIVTMP
jgi:hypothetical protein